LKREEWGRWRGREKERERSCERLTFTRGKQKFSVFEGSQFVFLSSFW
jgi:hypothetical protein